MWGSNFGRLITNCNQPQVWWFALYRCMPIYFQQTIIFWAVLSIDKFRWPAWIIYCERISRYSPSISENLKVWIKVSIANGSMQILPPWIRWAGPQRLEQPGPQRLEQLWVNAKARFLAPWIFGLSENDQVRSGRVLGGSQERSITTRQKWSCDASEMDRNPNYLSQWLISEWSYLISIA